jgi:hypothetical protein
MKPTICVGCGTEIEISRGATPRRWCSDACRKRTERAGEVEAVLAAARGVGSVEAAVQTLIEEQDVEAGSFAASLAELALAQARMTDAGNTHASVALRVTLENLDEVFGLRPSVDAFTLLDLQFGITREGVDPRSAVGRALIAAGRTDLVSHYRPPVWPKGWRGSALDGDPAEYAAAHNDVVWEEPAPLAFWPWGPCPNCGSHAGGEADTVTRTHDEWCERALDDPLVEDNE